MQYRSVADLNHAVVSNLRRVPDDVDLIVGVPRSGLLAASLIALHLNLPLTDLEGFLEGRILQTGRTRRLKKPVTRVEDSERALIVDDSVYLGREMGRVRELVAEKAGAREVLFCSVYVTPRMAPGVDLFFEVCPWPRVFEWNLMHHDTLGRSCVDIDGVICEDPTDEENDDGERYLEFLRGARPRLLPSVPVGWLVTSRLEKYREQTEEWLRRHGIQFQEVIMMDYPSQEARRAANRYAEHKATAYVRTGAELFIESSFLQARGIVGLSGKPVLCTETNELIRPDTLGRIRNDIRTAPQNLSNVLQRAARKLQRLAQRG